MISAKSACIPRRPLVHCGTGTGPRCRMENGRQVFAAMFVRSRATSAMVDLMCSVAKW